MGRNNIELYLWTENNFELYLWAEIILNWIYGRK